MTKISTAFPLPVELITDIIQLLPLPDQRSLSLTSQLTRKLALRFIFSHLRYTHDVAPRLLDIHSAGEHIKAAIIKIELVSHYIARWKVNEINTLFEILESCPNLHSFILIQAFHLFSPTDFPKLIASLRKLPLLEFHLDNGVTVNVEGQPTIGLSGLKKLSIVWQRNDRVDHPGSAHDHLYDLIRPSLSTLVHLHIDHLQRKLGPIFDLQLLKPAGNTLRSFRYSVVDDNQDIFDHIPVLFPHLTKLDIRWCKYSKRSILWNDERIETLARNKNITDLTVSFNFEVGSNDPFNSVENFAWFVRSYERRLKATQDVLSACEKLEKCCWIQESIAQPDLAHSFIIEERVLDDKVTKVVRGLMQDWMGQNYTCLETGGIVKCRLAHLPGDIIGEDLPLSADDDLYD